MSQQTINNYSPRVAYLAITLVAQLFRSTLDFVVSIRTSFKEAQKVRETIRELNRLSNAELADIGLSRGDIYSIATKQFDDYSDKIATKAQPNQNLRGWV